MFDRTGKAALAATLLVIIISLVVMSDFDPKGDNYSMAVSFLAAAIAVLVGALTLKLEESGIDWEVYMGALTIVTSLVAKVAPKPCSDIAFNLALSFAPVGIALYFSKAMRKDAKKVCRICKKTLI